MKMKELCESERPRERLIRMGASSLSDAELIAVLLGSGNRNESALELAHRLLRLSDGSLGKLFGMPSDRMREVKGIGDVKLCIVSAAAELGRRFFSEQSLCDKKAIVTSRMVYEIMLPELKGLDHEECWILLLNTSNYLMGKYRLTVGGDSSTIMDVRHVVRRAIEKRASGIILVHNHPSGNPLPSRADGEQTEALRNACNACGIYLMDHVIVCDDCYFSFSEGSSRKASAKKLF